MEAHQQARVEMRHVTTAGQWLEALQGHAEVSPAARRQRLLVVLLPLALVVLSVVALSAGGAADLTSLIPLALPAVVVLVLLLMLRRITARSQQRISEELGERRITADETGVCVETAHVMTRFGWPAMSRYVETPHLFVLVSADERASCLLFLPKRSTDGTDCSEGLRGLLDAHLPAAGAGR